MDQNTDSADQQPIQYKTMKVEILTVIFVIIGIGFYLADIITDLSLAMDYYYDRHIKFFWLTLFLVLLSAVVSSISSFCMYITDSRKFTVSKKVWIKRVIFMVCGIAPVLRSFDSLWFAWKSYKSEDEKNKEYYARRMIFEITDGSFLRLFEAFIESGPQLILQIYIFVEMQAESPNVFTTTEISQIRSILFSVLSISTSVFAYSISLRKSLDQRKEPRWFSWPVLFLWRSCEVIARVIAMGFAVSVSLYFCGVFAVHFIAVLIWVHFIGTNFCETWYAERFYNLLTGVILTFVFFNLENNATQIRCALFYVVMFMENTFMIVFWFISSPDESLRVPVLLIQILSFFLGVIFMVIYYTYFHPTVGELYNNVSETGTENEEPNAMIEMVRHAETVIQNGESNTVLEEIQNAETAMQNGEENAMLEKIQNAETAMQNGEANAMLEKIQNAETSEL